MATKHFCDICKIEIVGVGGKVWIGGSVTKIDILCPKCWQKAERLLLRKQVSLDISSN